MELAYFEWRPELRGREAPILLVHATGFHARCWDPVIRRLGERHVIAVDQRGHGRSQKIEITHWKDLGQDLAAFVEALDLRDVLGVGHSMGAHAMVDAAATRPGRFRRLVLIDPVIASPETYGGGGWTIRQPGRQTAPHGQAQAPLRVARGDDRALPRPGSLPRLPSRRLERLLHVRAASRRRWRRVRARLPARDRSQRLHDQSVQPGRTRQRPRPGDSRTPPARQASTRWAKCDGLLVVPDLAAAGEGVSARPRDSLPGAHPLPAHGDPGPRSRADPDG
ncbi:MAG: alpha/beta hydrolase [Deltaproteobacteria bacterium]|nr:alpha/beta hydrolase [Deltaproteobacteria bacterium]